MNNTVKTLAIVFFCLCFLPLCAKAAEDTTAPQVTALNLTPDTVDTSSSDQTLTLTLTLTDDQAGVCISSDCGSYSSSPTQLSLQPAGATQYLFFTDFTLISGDDRGGVYRATAIMPQGSMSSVWSTFSLMLVDKVGNYETYENADLEALFGDGAAEVTNSASIYDASAPEVTAFALTPETVNTDSDDQTLTLTLTLTDDQAGVCISSDCGSYSSSPTQLSLQPVSGDQYIYFTNFTRTSGNDLNGTYTGTATMPMGSNSGVWSTFSLMLVDKVGNYETYENADLEALFGDGAAEVTNSASIYDASAPEVTAFALTPETVNTDSTSQTLTLTITITDDQSGVCISNDCGTYIGSPTQIWLQPLIGTQFLAFTDFTRISGDNLEGTYTATATMPIGSKEGIWETEYLILVDRLGNSQSLSGDDLADLFPDAEGLTIVNTATASSVTLEREWTINSANAFATFPYGTIVTKLEDGRFAFYQMVNQEYSIDLLTDNNLTGDPVRTIHLGIPGLNLEFSQSVNVSLNVGSEYEGTSLLIQALGEEGDSWANETQCIVTGGYCSFTVDHATYFTANVQPPAYLAVGVKTGGGPHVTVWNAEGGMITNFMAYSTQFLGGVKTAIADVDGDGTDDVITMPYTNGGSHIRIFNLIGQQLAYTFAYSPAFRGGFSVATGDVDGDGTAEIIVAPTSGGGPQIRVFKYSNGTLQLYASFFAYAEGLRTGIEVFSDDVDGDGTDDIITATKAGAAPHIRTFDGRGNLLDQFFAFSTAYRGGVNVSFTDYDGDGAADLVLTPAYNGGPQYRVMKYDGTLIAQGFGYNQNWRMGLHSGSGDVDGDGQMEIVLAPTTGGPHIQIIGSSGLEQQFMAYASSFRGGIELSVADINRDGKAEIITTPIQDGGPHVRIFNSSGQVLLQFMSHNHAFRGGLNLSVSQ